MFTKKQEQISRTAPGFIGVEVLMVLVAITLLAAGGTLLYLKQKQSEPLPDYSIKELSINGKKLEDTATASWKTYRNEKYGFEVKYPALGARQEIEDKGVVIYFKDRITMSSAMITGFAVTVNENKQELSFIEWFKQNLDSEGVIKDYNKIFNHRSAIDGEIYNIKESLPSDYADFHGPTPSIYFITSDKKLVLTISPSQDYNLDFYGYDTPAKVDMLLNQILSTFKFVELNKSN